LEKKPCTPVLLHVLHVRQDDTVVIVRPVILDSLGQETTATALCATIVQKDGTNMYKDKGVVCHVFLDCTKIVNQRVIANNALKGNFQMQLN